MKVILNDDKIVLYLNKFMIEGLDFKNINGLEKYFRDLFIKLREIYNIKLNGFYYVYVYVDEFYGVVLELEHENIEFFDYDENDIDMHIVLEKTSFLYELEDIFDYYLRNFLSNYHNIQISYETVGREKTSHLSKNKERKYKENLYIIQKI